MLNLEVKWSNEKSQRLPIIKLLLSLDTFNHKHLENLKLLATYFSNSTTWQFVAVFYLNLPL